MGVVLNMVSLSDSSEVRWEVRSKCAVGVNQTGHRWEVLDNLLHILARVYFVDYFPEFNLLSVA